MALAILSFQQKLKACSNLKPNRQANHKKVLAQGYHIAMGLFKTTLQWFQRDSLEKHFLGGFLAKNIFSSVNYDHQPF